MSYFGDGNISQEILEITRNARESGVPTSTIIDALADVIKYHAEYDVKDELEEKNNG
jgi:hypothetical protein